MSQCHTQLPTPLSSHHREAAAATESNRIEMSAEVWESRIKGPDGGLVLGHQWLQVQMDACKGHG